MGTSYFLTKVRNYSRNSRLCNPDKMNNNIYYSILDNKKLLERITNANIDSIEGTTCNEDGQYIVKETWNKIQKFMELTKILN